MPWSCRLKEGGVPPTAGEKPVTRPKPATEAGDRSAAMEQPGAVLMGEAPALHGGGKMVPLPPLGAEQGSGTGTRGADSACH